MRTRRRRLLRASSAGIAATLAGCSSITNPSTSDPKSLGETQTYRDTSLSVDEVSVVGTFLRSTPDGFWQPTRLGLDRYVFVQIRADGCSPPSPTDLHFVTKRNDERLTGTIEPGDLAPQLRVYGLGRRYHPEDDVLSGWVAFETDVADHPPAEAYVEWQNRRWRLTEAQRKNLAGGVPAFEYATVTFPDRIKSGQPLTLRVAVKNTNPRYGGVCRDAIHLLEPRPAYVDLLETARSFSLEIGPGETARWTHTFDKSFTRAASTIRLDLRTHAGQRTLSVDVS